jgi:TonB family protein
LSGVEIDKVRLTRHKVELEGIRYGLHFLGAMPYEDPTKAVDRVRITPKKKFLKITIDRELLVTSKKKKDKEEKGKPKPASASTPAASPPASSGAAPAQAAPPAPQPASEPSDEDQAKAEMAAAPAEERPADPGSVTATSSPAHAAKTLKDALDQVFAFGLDNRMMERMPDFWRLYYQAVAAKADYRPKDPAVLRQNAVDQKAKLLSTFEPESNDLAQANGVAGPALYHTVIGADGKPGEIAVARPIGFGLDENAVAAIRKASFQPAMKDGKPVPVMLDLVVQFRIYSKRTAVAGKPDTAEKPADSVLPGPYSVPHP